MSARLGIGVDVHCSCPKLLSTSGRVIDCGSPIHALSLRGIHVQVLATHNLHAVIAPLSTITCAVFAHAILCLMTALRLPDLLTERRCAQASRLGSLLLILCPVFGFSSDVVFTRARWDSNLSKGIASMILAIDFARVTLPESNSAPESTWTHTYL